MQKQPHRTLEKIAENRWFQDQPTLEGHEELGPPKDLGIEGHAPPEVALRDTSRDKDDAPHKP
jgi:hypothetical protein